MEGKYIIVELIPTASNPEYGDIIQLSALKIENLQLVDRFDYRLKEEYIPLQDLVRMISYDKDKFIYKDTTTEILEEFDKWSEDIPILILNNQYTLEYLKEINNIKKDLCINLQHHGTDVCAELNIDLSNTYLFYCFGSLPTKLQYEKSKGTVNTSLSVIKIKYDKDKINKIYFLGICFNFTSFGIQ